MNQPGPPAPDLIPDVPHLRRETKRRARKARRVQIRKSRKAK